MKAEPPGAAPTASFLSPNLPGPDVLARAYLANAFAYPLWHLLAPEGATDPALGWWLVSAHMLLVGLLVPRLRLSRRTAELLLLSPTWLSSFQLCTLAIVNDMQPFYAVGSIMSMTIPVLFTRSVVVARQFAVIAGIAVLSGVWWSGDLSAIAYWSAMVIVLISAYWVLLVQQRSSDLDRAYRALLEAEVSARTEQLSIANEGLRREMRERQALQDKLIFASRMEGLGRLAGGIAHDYNNVLTAILGSAEYLEEVLPQGSEEHSEVQAIQRAGETAARITRHLLAFSRSSPIETEVLEPGTIISATVRMLQPLLPPGVRLVVELRHRDARIRANRGQLEQVILNLVLNARDAMPQGGKVVIETAERVKEGRTFLSLHVKDTGKGMDAQTRARIFDPFFTTKDVAAGTGLGLSIVYAIVERAGGTISVDSVPDQGTTFQICWPITDEPLEGLVPGAGLAPSAAANARILVVDDDPPVRRVLCRMIEAMGHRTLEAGGALEALKLAAAQPIDLLVTDVLMPEMTGFALARHLLDAGIGVPVLFISGHPERAGALEQDLPAGSGFLSKPFTREQLSERIQMALKTRFAGVAA
jgi:signal transduction histidine kinase/ActR/RegA family two-component response regulator